MKIWIIEYFFMLPHLYNFLLTILSLFLKHLIDIHLSAFRFYAPRISKDEVELYQKIYNVYKHNLSKWVSVPKLFNIESFTFVHFSEIEDNSARS